MGRENSITAEIWINNLSLLCCCKQLLEAVLQRALEVPPT